MPLGRYMLYALVAILGATLPLCAQKTTRKGLKTDLKIKDSTMTATPLDTLKLPGDRVKVTGYEKPLASRKESFHITNNTDADLLEVIADIKYLDYRGREIHKRAVNIKCDVPAGTTRMLSFPSWDVQNRFYFEGGPVPRTEAYPYHVEITITEALVSEEHVTETLKH